MCESVTDPNRPAADLAPGSHSSTAQMTIVGWREMITRKLRSPDYFDGFRHDLRGRFRGNRTDEPCDTFCVACGKPKPRETRPSAEFMQRSLAHIWPLRCRQTSVVPSKPVQSRHLLDWIEKCVDPVVSPSFADEFVRREIFERSLSSSEGVCVDGVLKVPSQLFEAIVVEALDGGVPDDGLICFASDTSMPPYFERHL